MKNKNKRILGYGAGILFIAILMHIWNIYWWKESYLCFDHLIGCPILFLAGVIPTTPGEIIIMGLLGWRIVVLINNKFP